MARTAIHREEERLLMFKTLRVPHTFNMWRDDQIDLIFRRVFSRGRMDQFLQGFGYRKRGRKFVYEGYDATDIPDIKIKPQMTAHDFPPEVINSAWLSIVLKRRAAAQRGAFTRRFRTHEREAERTVSRSTPAAPAAPTYEDDYSQWDDEDMFNELGISPTDLGKDEAAQRP